MIQCPRPVRRNLRCLVSAMLVLPVISGAAQAVVTAFPPGTEQTALRVERLGSYGLPIGPWSEGSMLTRPIEGRVEQTAWRIPAPDLGTLELLTPLRTALEADGWRLVFECETVVCGGFDFRYSTQVLPEPGMHVDLGDFRFLSARKSTGATEEHVTLLVSRSTGAGAGYVQMIHIGPAESASAAEPVTPSPALKPDAPAIAPGTGNDVWMALESSSVVLEGLEFAIGAADTARGADNVLKDLADYLATHQNRTLALVGHTDSLGAPETNLALSRRRAEAVRNRLIRDHGVAASRVVALGAGLMAPRDTNLTEEGRARNRRVEAILTSTR